MLAKETQEEVVAFAQEIIRIDSQSGQEEGVARAIEAKAKALAFDQVRVDEFGSVISVRKGRQPGPRILFDCHMDVVPVTNPEEWTSSAFAAQIRDGKIFGRGASDMKGPLAACLIGLGRIPTDEFNGSLIVSTSIGEEIIEGGGLASIMAAERPDFVVICEPNGNSIGIGQKGRAGLWVDVTGKPAHSSVPHLGDNAVYKSVDAIDRLRKMPMPHDDILGEGVLELIDAISRPFPSWATVPVGFTMRYDRRLVRGETKESVLADTRKALTGLPDWEIGYRQVEIDCYTGRKISSPDFHPGWVIAQDSPWIRKAERGIRWTGIDPLFTTARFCTNGSYSAGTAEIPTMIFGPSSGLMAHRIDEYIGIDELISGTEGYWGLARELTR